MSEALPAVRPGVADGWAIRPLEFESCGQYRHLARASTGAVYEVLEFGAWTENRFRLTIHEGDAARVQISHEPTLERALAGAQSDHEARILTSLVALPQNS